VGLARLAPLGGNMNAAFRVAVVGAESTGKTQLAQALQQAVAQRSGWRAAWVPEVLRQWCERVGRTPEVHEQASILRAQHQAIDAAAQDHDVVVCDTTGLMTAVYSRLIFGDHSLDERAAVLHRRMDLTLLTALDLPWVADGWQRDGPQVREPVDNALRRLLAQHRLPFSIVSGSGQARTEQAWAALQGPLAAWAGNRGPIRPGLFTRLEGPPSAGRQAAWSCECCADPRAEKAVWRRGPAGA